MPSAKKSDQDLYLQSHAELLQALKKYTDVQTTSSQQLLQRMDKLLSLFEEAAQHVGEVETVEARVTALTNKLEALLEQNKSIAQGLVLLEKYVRGKTRLEPTEVQQKPF